MRLHDPVGTMFPNRLDNMRRWIESIAAGMVCSLSLVACSTSHPAAPTTPATIPHKDSVTSESKSSSWAPQFIGGKWRYFIRDSSVVSISNDTTVRPRPIESTMFYSISMADSANVLVLTSHVDSLFVNTRLSTKTNSDSGKFSESHMIFSKQGRIIDAVTPTGVTCTSASASPSPRTGELIIRLPASHVRVGDRWTDTSSTTSCHGRIPLAELAIQEYELLDLTSCQGRDAVKVRRVVSDTFTSSPAESSNHLSASGSGTASSIVCLQRDTGTLLESNGQSRLDLTVITTRGTFPFTQNTNTHIEIR
jgi:hypothetical protein